jgi:hypothetical protein
MIPERLLVTPWLAATLTFPVIDPEGACGRALVRHGNPKMAQPKAAIDSAKWNKRKLNLPPVPHLINRCS